MLGRLPGYPLAEIPGIRRRLAAEGVDVIDLGAGDADLAPPPHAVERLRAAAADPALTRYPFQLGLPEFREAVARFMERRFGVSVDPFREVLPLIGSKEGIAKLPLALLDPGEGAVIPDPGYQAYLGGVLLARGVPHPVPLRPEEDFLVPLGPLREAPPERWRLLYLNYPNNPTAASAPRSYFEEAVELCADRGAALVHDHAYSEISFDGYRPPSVLELPGAREVAIEFHSLSKTFNATGWRLGWAVGNPELIGALERVKTFMDTGAYLAVQAAGATALDASDEWIAANARTFQRRRDVAVEALRAAGYELRKPHATMYLWVRVPGRVDEERGGGDMEPRGSSRPKGPSAAFALRALEEAAVVVMPGSALGLGGEGFFRIALTVPEERLVEGAQRLGRLVGGS